MKYKRGFPVLLALCLTAYILFLTGCEQSVTPQKGEDVPSSNEKVPESVRKMILAYLQNEFFYDGVAYFTADEPKSPREQDHRIDKIIYAGEVPLDEGIGVAYEVEHSGYYFHRKDANDEGAYSWNVGQPFYVVLQHNNNSGG